VTEIGSKTVDCDVTGLTYCLMTAW